MPSEAEIIGFLNTALGEGNYDDFVTWPDSDIAIDLCSYCPGMEHLDPTNQDLLDAIAAWRKQLKPKES